jgi:hypothetical protein
LSDVNEFIKNEAFLIGITRRIQDWEGTLNARSVKVALTDLFISMQKRRFVKSEARQGEPWKPLSEVTEIRSRGRRRVGDRPLVDTGRMMRSVQHEIRGTQTVIGSSVKDIPRAQHFGRKRMRARVRSHRRRTRDGFTSVRAHKTTLPAIPERPIKFDPETVRLGLLVIVREALGRPI